MSHYDNLDGLILARLRNVGPLELTFLYSGEVRSECDRLADALGRESFRVMGGRLQALRKAGKIEFRRWFGVKRWCWHGEEQA